ncbi:hypothetical protein CRI94_15615 [Longibacter salinarum]|uniref:DUF4397 domain-containing protein n=1 Tax=Longibacter salinarum TaxID=1850348 RepID=A0A2A8CUI8_9BACT|nr:DUF4397 domain-containing protein [Longibacter salinarum]PEN11459.1 hypothetical protein CRI94_15615 [Longibacter salinarum]
MLSKTAVLSRYVAVLVALTLGLFGSGCDALTTSESADLGSEASTLTKSAEAARGDNARGSSVADRRGQGSGPIADVRVGHLSPDAPAVDVYVGVEPGEGSPAIPNLSYANFAPNADGDYVGLRFGTYDIAVTPAGAAGPQVIDVDGLSLDANKDYTILAIGELSPENGEPGIQALPLVDNGDDEPALPPRDKTLVRFVHASPDAGAVDIAVDGQIVLVGVTFAAASPYLEVASGDRTVEILKGGTAVLTIPVGLVEGTKITAYVIGNATPEPGDAALSAVTTLDATSPGGTGPLGR